jgi:hypothetical protein
LTALIMAFDKDVREGGKLGRSIAEGLADTRDPERKIRPRGKLKPR